MTTRANSKSSRKRRYIYTWYVCFQTRTKNCFLFGQSDRLNKVLEFVSTVHDLCAVLGLDFLSTVTEVHPSLDEANGVQNKSISNETLSTLAETVLTLKEDKNQRLKKV